MKKVSLTLIAFCFFLSAWAYDFVSYVDGYYYTITSSTAPYTVQVTYETMGKTAAYTGALTIPATTTNDGKTYTVTSIGSLAFYDNGANGSTYGATSITLPSTITSIGSNAFRGCSKLTSITIPASVATIGSSAFLNCSNLASITILSNITTINLCTFQNCSNLASVTIPSTVTSIGEAAFDGCAKLTSMTIPSAVTSIDTYAFRNCSSLTSITIPSGITAIGQYTFYGCSGLTSATIPSSVTSIGDYAFNGCSSLATINCSAVTPPTIYSSTFSNTSATVVVPCSSISTYQAASYWSSFSNYKAATFIKDGIRYQPNTSCSEVSVVSNAYSGSVTIPASVTYNGNTYAVTSIADSAFYYCTSLNSVSIPEGITSIGVRAFSACYNCTSINLPSTLTSIGTYAFAACAMSSVTIPKGVTSMGRGAFQNNTNLTSLTISEGAPFISLYAFSFCTGLKSVVVPSSCALNEAAFANCTGIQSATILSSVIGDAVFQNCTALTSVQLSSSITAIGIFAFYGCTSLSSIYVRNNTPSSITLGSNVFYDVNKTSCTLYVPTGKTSAYQEAAQWQDFSTMVEPYIWDGSAWSTEPNAASDAIINGNYSGTGFACHDLTVNAGKQVTISSGTLAVSGSLYLKSDATNGTATLVNSGTLTVGGSTSVEQYLTSDRNWYISSPLSAATGNVVLETSGNNLWQYNEAIADWTTDGTSTSTPLSVMKGFVAKTGTDGVITFTGGTLNTGNQSITVNRTENGSASRGFNLVGNPYPSYLNWVQASAGSTNLEPTMWYRTKTSTVYEFDTYNASSGVGTSNGTLVTQYIPPMQAFWIRVMAGAGSTTGTFSVTNAMRSHESGTNRLKAPASYNTNQKMLRLKVSNGTNSDEAIVCFNPNAADEYDGYDSEKMSNNHAAIPEIYTLAGTEKAVINGLNKVTPDKELVLGFATGEANTFTIRATEISNLDTDTKIMLKDKLLNTEQELTTSTDYSFSSDSVCTDSRFSIVFKSTSTVIGVDDVADSKLNIIVFGDANGLIQIIRTDAVGEGTVTVSNMLGQKLTDCSTTGTTTVINRSFLPGVYLVAVTVSGRTTTQKILLN
jgi:hypothetical protein